MSGGEWRYTSKTTFGDNISPYKSRIVRSLSVTKCRFCKGFINASPPSVLRSMNNADLTFASNFFLHKS